MIPRRAALAWSSGKDSAWTLQELRLSGRYLVEQLVTTYNEATCLIPQHDVPLAIAQAQAAAAGIPLAAIPLPYPCPNEVYESRFRAYLRSLAEMGITCLAYGDLFLSDIRAYREGLHRDTGVEPLFPLWGTDTAELSRSMLDGGLRAIVTAVDAAVIPPDLAGLDFDAAFLGGLPSCVDPCGENGEFHTCVHDGPMFRQPVKLRRVATRAGRCQLELHC